MTDLTRSVYDRFVEGRTVYILDTIEESSDGGATWAALNLTSSSLSVRFRAWKRPPVDGASGYIIDQPMTKVTAASGIVGYYATFEAEYGEVECEIVVVDSAVTATGVTTTGYRESLWKRWKAEVVSAVRYA